MTMKNGRPKLRRPADKSLAELSEECKKTLHRIDKRAVSMKTTPADDVVKDAGGDATGAVDLGGTFEPSADQLSKINQYTRFTATANDVAAFNTFSCNDLFDRDDERFTTDTIDGFASLKEPFSFNGKSFMSDHNYEMASVRGRIFDTTATTQDGVRFLKNSVYVPKTEQYKNYLENLQFGLAWAVSVGVIIDKANCTICDAPVFTSRFFGSWCQNGHDKGLYYDPANEEKDDWGYFIPCDPETPGAVKAQVNLSDPIDGYEISQVFLGAQYYAELAKKPGFEGIIKAASARTIPIVGLSHDEAEQIPMPHEPKQVREARAKYTVTANQNGDPTWTDEHGLVWVFNTELDEVMSLGRKDTDGEAEGSGLGSEGSGEVVRADGDEVPVGADGEDGEGSGLGSGDAPEQPAAGGAVGGVGSGSERVADPATSDSEEEELNKDALLALMKRVGVPTSLFKSVEDASDNGLEPLLLAVKPLAEKAALGEKYIEQLRADAIAWYVKAHQDGDKPVSTENFSKMLDHFKDDVDMFHTVIEEQKELARAKFPASTRRSSFERDHNEIEPPADLPEATQQDGSRRMVNRIHR